MLEISSFLVVLSIFCFFLYWIFGGVIFSIITVLRVGRVRRSQFGCFFSLIALGFGVLTGWGSSELAAHNFATCVLSEERWRSWMEQFACGIVPILLSLAVGFVLLLIVGFYVLTISENDAPSWIEPRDADDDEEEDDGVTQNKNHASH